MTTTVVVIGYGNLLRGDDAVGPVVADVVRGCCLPGVRAFSVPQLTPELAEVLASASLAVFVDAWMAPEGASTEVLPVEPAPEPEPLGHTSDPGVVLALTRAVYGVCPPAWIVRIPAVSFQLGKALSPCASRGGAAALVEVLRLIVAVDVPREDRP